MRIAMVSEHASPLAVLGGEDAGGQNVHVAELSRALARRGVEVTVYTRRDDPKLPARMPLAPGVVVEHVDAGPPRPIPKDLLLPFMDVFADRLRQAWRRWRPTLVHAHFWMSGHAALAAADGLGVPVVQTFHALGTVKRRHQGEADTSPAERLETETRILARACGVVATCSDERRELALLGAPSERVRVVPCGVDLRQFRPEGPAFARARRPRLVALGRLVARKGVDHVVAALTRIPRAELIVAGGPEARALDGDGEARRLRELAQRLGVAERVALCGRVARADAPKLLRSADVVVCTPWYEPFGIVPVEAMACGVPVVASAVGGMLDTITDDVTGVLVAPQCPSDIADAVSRLLRDARLRARLGAAGAARAHARYGWEHVAEGTLDAYRVLAGVGVAVRRSARRHASRRPPAPIVPEGAVTGTAAEEAS
jgi:D-inositol-3-phosphate glycosyltransferase